MQSSIDKPKLVQVVADSYDSGELAGFLSDYFAIRLDYIVNPIGVGFVVVVREIVEYFDRKGTLVELVRELSKDRPGKIDLLSLLVPTSGPKAGAGPTGVLSNPVDVDPQVEVDF